MSDEMVPVDAGAVGDQDKAEGSSSARGALNILLPPDLTVWREARRMVSDRNLRVEDLATCCAQDPAIVIELLRGANAMYFSAGRPPITVTHTAIVRLGSDVVAEILDKVAERPGIKDRDVLRQLEIQRSRCRRTSIVSKIFAEALVKALGDDCQTAGLFLRLGDMLAVAHLRKKYLDIVEQCKPSQIQYRLSTDHRFDTEKINVSYLQRSGVPELVLFAVDRDSISRTADRAIMKPIVMAAGELVDAFDHDKMDKIEPGRKIPPKSAIRMLGLSDEMYLRVFERCSDYLRASQQIDAQKKLVGSLEELEQADAQSAYEYVEPQPDQALDSEIQNILESTEDSDLGDSDGWGEESVVDDRPARNQENLSPDKASLSQEVIEDFKLADDKKTIARVEEKIEITPPPQMRTSGANKMLTSVITMFDECDSSEDLLAQLLQRLINEGPFEKSALIVVSDDRKQAIVVAARGPKITNGQKLELNDPLSPLAKCFSKVQSFGSPNNGVSPFGSRAFALAPVDADHSTPVALYADCGNDRSLTFEARRIFRNVVEVLNQKLPQIPGGIPVELS